MIRSDDRMGSTAEARPCRRRGGPDAEGNPVAADEPIRWDGSTSPYSFPTSRGGDGTLAQGGEDLDRARQLSEECVDLGASEPGTLQASPSDLHRTALLSKGRPQVPGYDVSTPLGKGTYGEVWRGREKSTGIRVAIKFFAHGTGQQWLFLQEEVKRLAELDGVQGIVQLKDVAPDARPPHYVMAYYEQGSLAERLEKGPLPVPEALALFRQVAEALAYVHAKGIRHCDLKPGNVLLDARGRAVIADFGQAHFSSDASPALGTFFYMAPEQADLSRQIPDTRWDVYGLGALFYALLTGHPPREDEAFRRQLAGTAELSHRLHRYREWIRQAPRPTEHRRVRGMDPALADILDRCLEIDPDKRLRDAGEVLAALDRRERRHRQRPLLLFGLAAPILLLLFMAVAGFGVGEAALDNSRSDLTAQFLENEEVSARLVANAVQEKLEARLKLLKAYDQQYLSCATACSDRSELEKLLTEMMVVSAQTNSKFTEATVSDRDGTILAVVKDNNGVPAAVEPYRKYPHYSWRDWFSGGGDRPYAADVHYPPIRAPHVSDPYVSSIDHNLFISLSVPIHDPDDPGAGPVGVLEAAIRVQDINRWLLDVNMAKGFPVLLDNRRYCVLHQQEGKIEPRAGGLPPRFDFGQVEAGLARGQAGRLDDYLDPVDGQRYLAGFARMQRKEDIGWVEDVDWVVLVQHRRDAVVQPIEELRHKLIGIGWKLSLAAALLTTALWAWLFWSLRRTEHIAYG
jgi:serine/threonine protein kinase